MRFGRLGRLNRIDLRVRPGVDVAALRARLAAELPAGLQVERPEANIQRGASLTRSYRVNLNVLALVALFTGGRRVFSTQALAIVRRRAQLALLRTLGVTRRMLVATLAGEALAIGFHSDLRTLMATALRRKLDPSYNESVDVPAHARRKIRPAGSQNP